MLNIILIIFISFIPVVFWAYIFSNLNEEKLNKKRFLLGIFSGALSVVPILYMDKIIEFIKFQSLNFFEYASKIGDIFSSLSFSLSLSLFLFLLVIISFIAGIVFKKDLSIFGAYLRNFLIFLVFVFIIGIIFFFIESLSSNFSFLNSSLSSKESLYFGDTLFNTFKLIIFYYVLVAFIEESSKHFNFIGASILDIKDINSGVMYAIFVALGFSFIENILYFHSLYLQHGISFELTKTYFFRSIFSIIVHVFCSSVIAFFFTKAYLAYKKQNKLFPYLKTFFWGLSIGILLHFIFDFSLTIGFSFIIILYFVVGYLYVSSIFYRE